MRLQLERTGGFAGTVVRGTVDTRDLPPAEAAEYERLVTAADLPALAAAPPVPARGADRFSYLLTVTDGEPTSVRLPDGAIPPAVQPLVDRLMAVARRPRSSS